MAASSLVADMVIISFAGLVFSAAVSDILSYIVPNRTCLAIALLYPAYAFSAAGSVDWAGALGIAAAALGLGFVLFSFRICGAGDAKLFAAVALWAGPLLIVPLVLGMTAAGAIMAVYLWLHHRLSRAPVPSMVFQTSAEPGFEKQPMPYAAAIAVGALYVAFTLLRVS